MRQLALPLPFPPLSEGAPFIPVRMINEFVYCPRLAYLEWVQGEFAHNADTMDGARVHRRVDAQEDVLPEEEGEDELALRSVWLSSRRLGISGKVDLVEVEGKSARPVDYKRGKRPHVAGGVHLPERVQLCAQALLLREHGYEVEEGFIWFAGSRERVRVRFDAELVNTTLRAIYDLRAIAEGGWIPPPLVDSPKCPRCSLIGICLPDEVNHLRGVAGTVRPAFAPLERAVPLHVQEPRAYLRKDGERIIVEVEKEKQVEARLEEVSQIALFGGARMTTPLLHECLRRGIPVSFFTYGGWFLGHLVGLGHGNVEARIAQFRTAEDPRRRLAFARGLVEAKIANQRTLLRRNWRGEREQVQPALDDLRRLARSALRAKSVEELLGVEGAAASVYFAHVSGMLREDAALAFSFEARNRRPPRDPVNALLSFGYAVLVREWTVALSAVGLDPYRGLYHASRFGRAALSLDMMEPFRPLVVDSALLMAVNNGEITAEDFLQGANACALTPSGRKKWLAALERRLAQEITHPVFGYRISYRRLFEVQARLLARWFLGEFADYPWIRTR